VGTQNRYGHYGTKSFASAGDRNPAVQPIAFAISGSSYLHGATKIHRIVYRLDYPE
jgi:hypothetical protein